MQICPPLTKANRLLKISHVITIKDINTDKTKEYLAQSAKLRHEEKKIKRITCKSFNITKLYGQR